MRMSDLQTKEIISVTDGKRVGVITDIVIDSVSGGILELILEEGKSKRFLNINAREERSIKWNQIIKIGEDIILVDTKGK